MGMNGGRGVKRQSETLVTWKDPNTCSVRAPILLSQLAIRLHLALAPSQPEKQLSIINMASIAGHRAASHASIYGVSKHALIGLTKNVAVEYAEQGVRCNSISPVRAFCLFPLSGRFLIAWIRPDLLAREAVAGEELGVQ